MALVDQTTAARLVGVTRQTISRKIRVGELSANNRKIDTSELIRVYGSIKDDTLAPNTPLQPDNAVQSALQAEIDALTMRLAVTKEQLVKADSDRKMYFYIAKTATENVKLITHQQSEAAKTIAESAKPAISPVMLVAVSVTVTFTLCVSAFALAMLTK